ncbi:MAG TPA: hypothetical protein VFE23_22300 [Usitatibacter sp.]|jgi:hypothetical protein|nr:hypothetical protein [Usitatibacter sp.]
MALDVLVPDLLVPADAPAALREVRLPHLERWLVRSELERRSAHTATEALAAAYGIEPPVPLAAVSIAGEDPGDAAPGGWLRADPVHLRVDRDSVTLHDPAVLGVRLDEARILASDLQALFTPDFVLHVAAPDRWYIHASRADLPATTPLPQAVGRNVFGLLPRSQGRMRWAAVLTEAQMVLSGHPVNAAREAAGEPPINSLWFWGDGETPASVPRPYADVHGEDVFARGLARLSGARIHRLPERLGSLDVPASGESALLVLSTLSAPLKRNEPEAWLAAARELDERWFAQLAETIERFDRVRLVLPSEKGTRIATLTPRSKLRWYRRAKPLAHHA